jgi:hypothetical protein
MNRRMRALALCLVAAGCQGAANRAAPAAPSLAVHVAFAAPASSDGKLQIAAAELHLAAVTAVSDRSASDERARLRDVDLSMGAGTDALLSPAPPGLYSSVNALLGGSDGVGVDLAGAFGSTSLHVTLASAPFVVACPTAVRLDPDGRVQLSLRADPSHWFDGVDLTTAISDSDDEGILLSSDDNRVLADGVLANVIASFRLDCAP